MDVEVCEEMHTNINLFARYWTYVMNLRVPFYRPSHQLRIVLRLLYVDSRHRCFKSIHMDVEVCDDMSPMGLERLTLCNFHLIYI